MNIFNLAHLNELVKKLPDPKKAMRAEDGYSPVLRLPVQDLNTVQHTYPVGGADPQHASAYAEFEIMMCRDAKGASSPRWVLRGLVAM